MVLHLWYPKYWICPIGWEAYAAHNTSMEPSTSGVRNACVTAMSGCNLAGKGRIVDRSDSGLRLMLEIVEGGGSPAVGEIVRIEAAGEIIVSEILAYRSEIRGYCVLLAIVHVAVAAEFARLQEQYRPEAGLDQPDAPPPLRETPPPRFSWRPLAGALAGFGEIAALRLSFATAGFSPDAENLSNTVFHSAPP